MTCRSLLVVFLSPQNGSWIVNWHFSILCEMNLSFKAWQSVSGFGGTVNIRAGWYPNSDVELIAHKRAVAACISAQLSIHFFFCLLCISSPAVPWTRILLFSHVKGLSSCAEIWPPPSPAKEQNGNSLTVMLADVRAVLEQPRGERTFLQKLKSHR